MCFKFWGQYGIILFAEAWLHLNKVGFFERDLYLNKLNKSNVITFQERIKDPSSNKIGQAPWCWFETASVLPSSGPHCPFRLLIWN